MPSKARQYKPTTVRRLDTLSRNQCAEPNCNKPLIAKDGETIISKICHIEAASVGGARYRTNMTDDERRHFNNLILLCDECHSIIDNLENESKYPVSLLKEWKKNHESKQLDLLKRNPSLLGIAINAIADLDFDITSQPENESLNTYNPAIKIKYNSIKRNITLIEEYKVFYSKVNALYDELEYQGSFKKENLLRNIKHIYLKIKGKYTDGKANAIDIIQENSDNIIEDIQEELLKIIEPDNNHYVEDITFGISIIMVDAFIRCKILEEPPVQ
jgi:hypothetical protein